MILIIRWHHLGKRSGVSWRHVPCHSAGTEICHKEKAKHCSYHPNMMMMTEFLRTRRLARLSSLGLRLSSVGARRNRIYETLKFEVKVEKHPFGRKNHNILDNVNYDLNHKVNHDYSCFIHAINM